MSWYTTTYVGIQDKDGKIYPFGPYDAWGNLHYIYSHSRSFTSDINEEFYPIKEEMISDELRKEFEWLNDPEDDCLKQYFEYLPYDEIPKGNYIKSGYCLIEQIKNYLDDAGYFEGFYSVLTPTEYAMRLENELKFGPPKPKKDSYGEEYTEPSMSEYSYFTWPDYNCREWEAYLMRRAIGLLEDYKLKDEGYKYVIIKTEG